MIGATVGHTGGFTVTDVSDGVFEDEYGRKVWHALKLQTEFFENLDPDRSLDEQVDEFNRRVRDEDR